VVRRAVGERGGDHRDRRDFRRKAENGGKWDKEAFDKFVGVPWELYPGARRSSPRFVCHGNKDRLWRQ
jgi:hypothetical protein